MAVNLTLEERGNLGYKITSTRLAYGFGKLDQPKTFLGALMKGQKEHYSVSLFKDEAGKTDLEMGPMP